MVLMSGNTSGMMPVRVVQPMSLTPGKRREHVWICPCSWPQQQSIMSSGCGPFLIMASHKNPPGQKVFLALSYALLDFKYMDSFPEMAVGLSKGIHCLQKECSLCFLRR